MLLRCRSDHPFSTGRLAMTRSRSDRPSPTGRPPRSGMRRQRRDDVNEHTEIQVYVRDNNGELHTIDVSSSVLVEDFRTQACDRTGVGFGMLQSMHVMKGPQKLDPRKSLRGCGVRNESELRLICSKTKVEVKEEPLPPPPLRRQRDYFEDEDEFPAMVRHPSAAAGGLSDDETTIEVPLPRLQRCRRAYIPPRRTVTGTGPIDSNNESKVNDLSFNFLWEDDNDDDGCNDQSTETESNESGSLASSRTPDSPEINGTNSGYSRRVIFIDPVKRQHEIPVVEDIPAKEVVLVEEVTEESRVSLNMMGDLEKERNWSVNLNPTGDLQKERDLSEIIGVPSLSFRENATHEEKRVPLASELTFPIPFPNFKLRLDRAVSRARNCGRFGTTAQANHSKKHDHSEGSASLWTCNRCTFENIWDRLQCRMCEATRPRGVILDEMILRPKLASSTAGRLANMLGDSFYDKARERLVQTSCTLYPR